MGWLLLAALAIIWAAFLLPTWRGSANRSVREFERGLDLLAGTEGSAQGRWIITPRRGIAFVGPRARAQARARERRRRALVFMLESIGLTFMIGLVPPLRVIWYVTAALLALLGLFVWLLVSMKSHRTAASGPRAREIAPPDRPKVLRHRYVAGAASRTARPSINGLTTIGGDDFVNVVVRPAGQHAGV